MQNKSVDFTPRSFFCYSGYMPKKTIAKHSTSAKLHSDKKKKSSSNVVFKITGAIVVLLIAVGLWYSVTQYQSSDEEQTGFLVCNKENTICENSQHIHADIDVQVCGKEIEFGKEKGRTDKQHTHKEKNKIHWHARMRVDPVTKQPLDPTLISVQSFLDQMAYSFPTSCPNNPSPTMKVTINNVQRPEGLQAHWVDGDKIHVIYQ